MTRKFLGSGFRRVLSGLASGALLCAAGVASASETYPGAIQDALGLECAPACTICHRDLLGGSGTVEKPFGLAIRGTAFLNCCTPDAIPDALGALSADTCTPGGPSGVPQPGKPCDSDGDGVSDIDELKEGRDPNPGGALFCSGPKYGCGAHLAPAAMRIDWVSLLMAGAAAAVLARQVRRARKPR